MNYSKFSFVNTRFKGNIGVKFVLLLVSSTDHTHHNRIKDESIQMLCKWIKFKIVFLFTVFIALSSWIWKWLRRGFKEPYQFRRILFCFVLLLPVIQIHTVIYPHGKRPEYTRENRYFNLVSLALVLVCITFIWIIFVVNFWMIKATCFETQRNSK